MFLVIILVASNLYSAHKTSADDTIRQLPEEFRLTVIDLSRGIHTLKECLLVTKHTAEASQ